MEPRRRRQWTFALTAEALVVFAFGGWLLSRLSDDDALAWFSTGLAWLWVAGWMACIAIRPVAARKFAIVTLAIFMLSLFVLALIT